MTRLLNKGHEKLVYVIFFLLFFIEIHSISIIIFIIIILVSCIYVLVDESWSPTRKLQVKADHVALPLSSEEKEDKKK